MSGDELVGVINAGSSSLKFALYSGDDQVLSGQVEGIGVRPAMKARGASGQDLEPMAFDTAQPVRQAKR